MQYGYFDDNRKEYVITRPDTPRSWANYLGSTEYGALITNNAGGYSFFHSAAQGRFMRLRFNAVPMDQPGRYFYLRDLDSGDYWSASWQPVGKPLDRYKSICRHGTAYTIIESEYSQIRTETTYFVPLGKFWECWLLKVSNQDSVRRRLRLFTFVEYANNWHIWQDQVNLQYTQFIVRMQAVDNILDHGINVLLPDGTGDFQHHDGNRHTFLAAVGADITGYDTDREVFVGPYHGYHNPQVVQNGRCTSSLACGDNACGVLQMDVVLDPDQAQEVAVFLGIGKAAVEGRRVVQEYRNLQKVHQAFDDLKHYWHSRLEGLTVQTPDPECNSMLNMWSPFNCLMTYAWSRAASLVYSGERDGLGYRDTVQDLLGVLHLIPHEARTRLELMLTGQVSTGGAMPVVKPFAHHPGHQTPPAEEEYRSDDCLWLFCTVPAYVKETGDLDFYDRVLPYADTGQDTVLGHLKRALDFSLSRCGAHGLPCGLSADWNDCLQLGHSGESVFVAFQLRYALKTYAEICQRLARIDEARWAQAHLERLDDNIERYAWDGQWFLRAYRHDGMKFGSRENPEGRIWLNPQTWAVLSGFLQGRRAREVMDQVARHLATDYGLMICDPPYEKTDHHVVKASLFNQGMKENASIFSHTQGWAVMAEAMLGRGDRAYRYFRAYLPAAYNNRAHLRQIEPYVYCQFTHSRYSPRAGASRLPWLTGAAAWSYYAATQYILGVQPDYDGLRIDPCLPSEWKRIRLRRRFRNKWFEIEIQNEKGVQKGVRHVIVDGRPIEGNLIRLESLSDRSQVQVILGD